MPEILEYRKRRGQQLRDQILFKIVSQLDEHNITLVELTEFYKTKYDSLISVNRLQSHRASTRRKEIARKAINTRWKRHFDFLKGSETYADTLKKLGAGSSSVEIPKVEELKKPNPPMVRSDDDNSSDLDDALSMFGG